MDRGLNVDLPPAAPMRRSQLDAQMTHGCSRCASMQKHGATTWYRDDIYNSGVSNSFQPSGPDRQNHGVQLKLPFLQTRQQFIRLCSPSP